MLRIPGTERAGGRNLRPWDWDRFPGGRRPRQKRHRRSGSDIDGCKKRWDIGEMLRQVCIYDIAIALLPFVLTMAGLELDVCYHANSSEDRIVLYLLS